MPRLDVARSVAAVPRLLRVSDSGAHAAGSRPRPGGRQRRLGQNFLADPNFLDLIAREAGLGATDIVLEVGGGGGALTERLAPSVACLHVIELDERLRPELEPLAAEAGNVNLVWGDAMRTDLGDLQPQPGKMVSNLPYSIATPLLLRTTWDLPSLDLWLVMVQREIAERLRAEPGRRAYGGPSALVQLACQVELVRTVDPAVFTPRPRVESALVRLRRRAPGAAPGVRRLVRDAFAHRRKSLARSLELAQPGAGEPARVALEDLGRPADARAETLAPELYVALAKRLSELGTEGYRASGEEPAEPGTERYRSRKG
jgi:16S rRNA (adenine1518-N6/adenine1519-N6)-dimethyltransferase